MLWSWKVNSRRTHALALALGLVVVLSSLSGCAAIDNFFDKRLVAIESAIFEQAAKEPYLIGLKLGDVKKALKDTGNESVYMIPILLPELAMVNDKVMGTTPLEVSYESLDEAAATLAPMGKVAWQEWLYTHPKAVQYSVIEIPVLVVADDSQITVNIEPFTFHEATLGFSKANAELFTLAAERMPQWSQAIIHATRSSFVEEVTGIPAGVAHLVTSESCEAGESNTFSTELAYPDPKAVIEYQTTKAIESYGDKKIFGGLAPDAFQREVRKIVDVPASVGDPRSTTVKLTVEVSTEKGSYSASLSMAENLIDQVSRYSVTPQNGSFAALVGVDEAWDSEIGRGIEALKPQFVPAQTRPGTGLLQAGKSGQPFKVITGPGEDRHVTFFKWGTSTPVVSAYVKAGATLNIRVPVGSYRLVYASGDTWYGNQYSFGPSGYYHEFKESYSSPGAMKIDVRGNYEYTVWIETTGNQGNSVPSGSTENPYDS
ncbi:MAG: hypothetical protein FWD55_02180 [Propionibacteriaceae bacterium]|nr:hypothetical protein [Propionibacteriaceae bacterium]